MSGRPTGSAFDPNLESGVATEAVVIDARGRFQIPTWIADEVIWIHDARESGRRCQALAAFTEPGVIRLFQWEATANPIVERRRELIEGHKLEQVRLLEQRYRRLLIPKDLRPSIGLNAAAHLNLAADASEFVHIVLEAGEITLVNQEILRRQLTKAEEDLLFENLP